MAYTEIYVDPAIAANSGTGTVGDPYGDLDYAIVQTTQGAAGTRFNIKRGTDEVLTRELGQAFADTSVRAAWVVNAVTTPTILQGYDTVAGDLAGTGNRAGISGGGSVMVLNGAIVLYFSFIDLHLHNSGLQSGGVVRTAGNSSLIRCEIDNNIGRGCLLGTGSLVIGCYLHNVTTNAIDLASGFAYGNIVTNTGSKEMAIGINMGATGVAMNNIISVDGATQGIVCADRANSVVGNSIYSAGGTGIGIYFYDTGGYISNISNNLIEGFSGSGGLGIKLLGSTYSIAYGARNLIYDCETAISLPGDFIGTFDTHGLAAFYETLTVSPFADAAGFDFSPVDTGNVKEGAYPPAFMTI